MRRGLEGDGRHHAKHDKPSRAVSLLDLEQLEELAREGLVFRPGELGENLTVSGANVRNLLPGTRLRVGTTILQIEEPRIPCYVLNQIMEGLEGKMWGRCGVMASVVVGGMVRRGDAVEVLGNAMLRREARASLAGAILAGGLSSRMGTPKAGVRLPDGRTMFGAVYGAVSEVCERVIVLGECRGVDREEYAGLVHLPDLHPQHGPISGIEALLASGVAESYLVIACDQPLVSPYLLNLLCHAHGGAGVFLRDEMGKKHAPFPGIFEGHWLGEVRHAMEAGQYSVNRVVQPLCRDWRTIPMGLARELASIDTRESLETLCG